ncbi:FecR family protein [Stenotrophomonas sp. ATCM1_4]|uniref:FecR family protein n=1 Tax=Stenotrophomonas sp. ATCM1_4 TaxID=2259330 RepID=UPI001048DDEA|nr:FecR family protein [Stenotrophomonas sp. ATCM1_4]TDB26182.1 FecR family protein [Stenotrophomonas sp. ATCM1_4]
MNTPSLQDFPDSAEDWLARLLSPECTASDHAAFEEWLALSPRNVLDYAEVERIHQLAGALAADPALHEAKPRPAVRTPATRRQRAWLRPLAWAAALVLAVSGGLWLLGDSRPSPPSAYATEIGKQRRVDLPDGSSLVLDTNTLVQVSYQRSQRHVALLKGRIQASVAHDADRPFVVTSGNGSVRALGTVFQVQRQDGGTLVALLEGRVIVSTQGDTPRRSIELHPLQQLAYDADGTLGSPQRIERNVAEGWTQGRLIFEEERLADLVTEFNRYSHGQLVLSGSELGEIRVSGVFNAGDQTALLATLRQGWGLQAQPIDGNRIELSASHH